MSHPDLIVIGAGHNGLVAATTMARRGKKVLVLERRPVPGGVAAGEEFHPGYRSAGLLHDTTGLRPQVVQGLGLERHGLRLHPGEPSTWIAAREGEGILLDQDPARTVASLAKRSAKDAAAWPGYRAFLGQVRKVIRPLLDEVPPETEEPQLTQVMRLLRSAVTLRLLGADSMMEILRTFPMAVADLTRNWFETELLCAGLAAPAVHGTWLGPWSPGSATNLLLREIAVERSVVGGPAALVESLVKAARQAGVEIRCDAAVTRIQVEGRVVKGVELADGEVVACSRVAASCDPRTTFLGLIDPFEVGERLEDRIRNVRVRGTTAKVNLALSGRPVFPGMPDGTAFVRAGETLDEIEQAFDAVKYGEFARRPVLELYLPTVEDPSLAPAGHHVASVLVHFAAHDLDGGWTDQARDQLGEAVMQTLEGFAPGFGELEVGREVLTPADLESRYGLSGGQVTHGEQAIDQWILRPSPECSRYATPIQGLYLCGSGSHPGGGITGAPGHLAASVLA